MAGLSKPAKENEIEWLEYFFFLSLTAKLSSVTICYISGLFRNTVWLKLANESVLQRVGENILGQVLPQVEL